MSDFFKDNKIIYMRVGGRARGCIKKDIIVVASLKLNAGYIFILEIAKIKIQTNCGDQILKYQTA
ncbi:MAG: hypothetical protein DRJ10_06545 [Bacteroidetes bacterium]|nr:MAG: hypothetical protein DRJ10_06545 [Bacteroidota bacterium]RLD86193.1 MAG: hypothetical protein DRJ07_01415 [Bacteroidota bacterium]